MTQTEERNYLRHILNIDTSLQSIAKSLKQIAENTKPIAYCVSDPFGDDLGECEPENSRENPEV